MMDMGFLWISMDFYGFLPFSFIFYGGYPSHGSHGLVSIVVVIHDLDDLVVPLAGCQLWPRRNVFVLGMVNGENTIAFGRGFWSLSRIRFFVCILTYIYIYIYIYRDHIL